MGILNIFKSKNTDEKKKNYDSSKSGTMKLKVEGMHCKSCEMLIQDDLSETKGVKRVKASHEKKEVIVDYDDTEVQEKQLEAKLKKLGYKIIK